MAWNQPGGQQSPWGRRPGGNSRLDERVKDWQRRLESLFRPGGTEGGSLIFLVVILALLLWLASGLFQIKAAERGVIQRTILGYSIDATYEGLGLAREAVGAIVTYAFETLRLHRVEANYQPSNARSAALLRALEFVIEGYARDYLFLDGAWRDHILTSRTNPNPR